MSGFCKTPHILTKSLRTPLYKGEWEGEVFAKDLTYTSPSTHLHEMTWKIKITNNAFVATEKKILLLRLQKLFSQGREQFFLSIVAKTRSNSLFADTWNMLQKFYTTDQKR